MSRADRAKEYFIQGYTCSQAVVLAFEDLLPVNREQLLRLTLLFGGGIGRLRLTCGAVSGMVVVIGLLFGSSEIDVANKKETYAITQRLCARFKEAQGSLICGELLQNMHVAVEVGGEASPRDGEYYKKRSCADTVYSAAAIVEEYLTERGIL